MDEPHEKEIVFENENDSQTRAIIDHSEIIEFQLKAIKLKINRLEVSIKQQKLHKKRLEEEIVDLEAELRNNTSLNESQSNSEEQTIEQWIANNHVLHELFPGTIIGVFCTLWEAEDPNLHSVLSEFLGLDTNLAIVCVSHQPIESFERGFHCLASSLERIMDDRIPVVFIEDLCPYRGDFVYDDPQRRLDLGAPTLPNGEKPRGFLGFAVNMVNIKRQLVFDVGGCGYGLRETLLYSVFSHLQVYKTRELMMDALSCISDGAVSLDGAIVFTNGAFSPSIWDEINGGDSTHVAVTVSESSTCCAQNSVEKQIEDKNNLVAMLLNDIRRHKESLQKERMCFDEKKLELRKFANC